MFSFRMKTQFFFSFFYKTDRKCNAGMEKESEEMKKGNNENAPLKHCDHLK